LQISSGKVANGAFIKAKFWEDIADTLSAIMNINTREPFKWKCQLQRRFRPSLIFEISIV
jgi:hypothetical protein